MPVPRALSTLKVLKCYWRVKWQAFYPSYGRYVILITVILSKITIVYVAGDYALRHVINIHISVIVFSTWYEEHHVCPLYHNQCGSVYRTERNEQQNVRVAGVATVTDSIVRMFHAVVNYRRQRTHNLRGFVVTKQSEFMLTTLDMRLRGMTLYQILKLHNEEQNFGRWTHSMCDRYLSFRKYS
jgi:hypothetical protein